MFVVVGGGSALIVVGLWVGAGNRYASEALRLRVEMMMVEKLQYIIHIVRGWLDGALSFNTTCRRREVDSGTHSTCCAGADCMRICIGKRWLTRFFYCTSLGGCSFEYLGRLGAFARLTANHVTHQIFSDPSPNIYFGIHRELAHLSHLTLFWQGTRFSIPGYLSKRGREVHRYNWPCVQPHDDHPPTKTTCLRPPYTCGTQL